MRVTHIIYYLTFTMLLALSFAFFTITIPFFAGQLILRPAYVFVIPLGLWFGISGCLSAYLSFFLGMLMIGVEDLMMNSLWSLHTFWLALIPLLAFRYFKADPELNTAKGQVVFVVFGLFIGNLVCTTWGTILPALFGFWPWFVAPMTWTYWTTGNLISIGTFTPLILNFLTRYIRHPTVRCR